MPITEQQRQSRRNYIGASDMPAILGLSPWRSGYDTWLEKTGRVEMQDRPNASMELGTLLEYGVLKWAEQFTGKLRRNQFRVCEGTPLGAHLDAVTVEKPRPVEAKVYGVLGPLMGNWGDSGTDEVPDDVVVQVTTQMLCLAPLTVESAAVAALLGGRGFCLFEIPWNADLADAIRTTACEWWERYVVEDIPPTDSLPSVEMAKLVRRQPASLIECNLEDYDAHIRPWIEARDARLAASKIEEQAQRAVYGYLGDNEAARLPDGRLLKVTKQTRKAYSVPEGTSTVMRITKGK